MFEQGTEKREHLDEKVNRKKTINKERWILLIYNLKHIMKRRPSAEAAIKLNNDIILGEEQQT